MYATMALKLPDHNLTKHLNKSGSGSFLSLEDFIKFPRCFAGRKCLKQVSDKSVTDFRQLRQHTNLSIKRSFRNALQTGRILKTKLFENNSVTSFLKRITFTALILISLIYSSTVRDIE